MRQRSYELTNAVNLTANTPVVPWATTGTDGTNPFMPGPFATIPGQTLMAAGQALTDQGIQGRLWYYKYVTLSFTITVRGTPTGTVDQYRVLILKQRSSDVTFTNFETYLSTQFCMGRPVIEKDWKVLYDKVFTMTTGLSTNTLQAIGGTNVLCMQSPPRRHSFRFPFKYRAQYTNDLATIWQPPLGTWVFVVSRDGQVTLGDITSTAFFTE